MSWGEIKQGVVHFEDSIGKYEHDQISNRNRNYQITTSFKSWGDTNFKSRVVVFNYQLQTLLNIMK